MFLEKIHGWYLQNLEIKGMLIRMIKSIFPGHLPISKNFDLKFEISEFFPINLKNESSTSTVNFYIYTI